MTPSGTSPRLLGLLLVLALAAAGCSDDDPDPGPTPPEESTSPGSSGPEPDEPRDWLAPDQEILVGTQRYVSPCQVLTPEVVGPAADGAVVRETYLDRSLPRETSAVQTTCWYDGGNAILTLEQYPDAEGPLPYQVVVPIRDPRAADRELRRWERAAQSSSPEAAAFLDALRAGHERLPDVFRDRVVDPIVLTGDPGTNQMLFTGRVGSLRFELTGEPASTLAVPVDDGELLELAARSYAALVERAADPALAQSPAPTIRGASSSVGNTPVLEVCAVLDRAAFRRATGLEQTQATERQGLPARAGAAGQDPGGPYSQCTRGWWADGRVPAAARRYGPDGYFSVKLELQFPVNQTVAEAGYREQLRDPAVSRVRPVDVGADEAHLVTVQVFGGSTTLQLRVGPYLADVSSIEAAGYGRDLPSSETLLRRVGEEVAANLEAQAAEAAEAVEAG